MPISLGEAELRLTDCIKEMERVVLNDEYDAKDIAMKQQAIYAIGSSIDKLLKVKDALHIEKRISKLEQQIEANQP